jgi:N-acetylglucosamine-6-phosphate deacetylase
MVQYFCQKSRDIPIILTIAPEENDMSYIRKLAKEGVIVSVGHSNATFCRAAEAFANGAKMATHLFNAMSPFEGRQPGVVGAAFDSDVYAGIIVDGVHSDFASVRIAKKIKGNKLFIVTDAAASMGTNLTEFEFGGFKVFVKDGICRNENGALAGSNIDMMSSVKNAVSSVGIPLEEALRMATLYPAEVMGLDGKLGRIDKGMTANLVVFDKDFKVKSVFFEGVTASD